MVCSSERCDSGTPRRLARNALHAESCFRERRSIHSDELPVPTTRRSLHAATSHIVTGHAVIISQQRTHPETPANTRLPFASRPYFKARQELHEDERAAEAWLSKDDAGRAAQSANEAKLVETEEGKDVRYVSSSRLTLRAWESFSAA